MSNLPMFLHFEYTIQKKQEKVKDIIETLCSDKKIIYSLAIIFSLFPIASKFIADIANSDALHIIFALCNPCELIEKPLMILEKSLQKTSTMCLPYDPRFYIFITLMVYAMLMMVKTTEIRMCQEIKDEEKKKKEIGKRKAAKFLFFVSFMLSLCTLIAMAINPTVCEIIELISLAVNVVSVFDAFDILKEVFNFVNTKIKTIFNNISNLYKNAKNKIITYVTNAKEQITQKRKRKVKKCNRIYNKIQVYQITNRTFIIYTEKFKPPT